jgi:hypothetical protein
MTTSAEKWPDLWPEQWAIQAAVEADRLSYRLKLAQAGVPAEERHSPSAEAVRHHIAMARDACVRPAKRRRRSPRDKWRGTLVEQAYRNLHAAKIFMVDELREPDLAAQVPEVSARMAVVLDRGDPRRTQLEKGLLSTDPATRRVALRQAMEVSYDASDEGYARLRDFRNIILLTSLVLMLAAGVLALAVALVPRAMPLCFTPIVSGAAPTVGQSGQGVCPSGEGQTPTPGDVLIVIGLGALGGGLAALFAIRNLRGTSTPYSLPVALAVLKVPSGALTAVAGLLLLGGGFAPGFSNLDSQRQILAYALVLGYAQQLITRLVDDRAQSILDKIPSKDPDSAQAQGAATRVEPPATAPGPQAGQPPPGGPAPAGPATDGPAAAPDQPPVDEPAPDQPADGEPAPDQPAAPPAEPVTAPQAETAEPAEPPDRTPVTMDDHVHTVESPNADDSGANVGDGNRPALA